jgi:UDP-GlcNAc3NAcA epimerase
MIKIVTIIGARPQIIKAAALSRAIKTKFSNKIEEIIVHTGQHYDAKMSEIFFTELGIPKEKYNLGVGSMSHGKQTAKMIEGIEDILATEKPNFLVVYGDTNSTLAGAIAASKIHIPIVHIEAGLRSFNKKMPEEINRILCDHCSTLLFTPTISGFKNLINEGLKANNLPPFTADNPKVYHCGDIMYDNSLYFANTSATDLLNKHQLKEGNFVLVTVHRAENTDDMNKLVSLFGTFNFLSKQYALDFIIPLHPRTSNLINQHPEIFSFISENKHLKIIEPVSFIDMIVFESNSKLIMTDSGGVQKEAFFFKKPCIILRNETEWTELVECGAAQLVGIDAEKIKSSFEYYTQNADLAFPELFGNGQAAEFICEKMLEVL